MTRSTHERLAIEVKLITSKPEFFTVYADKFPFREMARRIKRADEYEATLLSRRRPMLEMEAKAGLPTLMRICYFIHPDVGPDGRSHWVNVGHSLFGATAKRRLRSLRVHRAWGISTYRGTGYAAIFDDLLLAQAYMRAITQTRALMILRDEI
jgi:hypothetical protein